MKEKEIKYLYLEEESETIQPPYYRIMYIDDQGTKHLATIKDKAYLKILLDRYGFLELKKIKS